MAKVKKYKFDFSDFAGYKPNTDIESGSTNVMDRLTKSPEPISEEQKQKNKALTDNLIPKYAPAEPKLRAMDLLKGGEEPQSPMYRQNQEAVSENTQPKVVSQPDSWKDFATDLLAAPLTASLGGIVQGGKTMKRGMDELGDTNILTGLADPSTQKQTLTGLTSLLSGGAQTAFGAATPFVPAIAGFSAGSELANKVVPEGIMKYVNQPVTSLTNPNTQLGKNVANLGDIAAQLLLAKAGEGLYKGGKNAIMDRLSERADKRFENTPVPLIDWKGPAEVQPEEKINLGDKKDAIQKSSAEKVHERQQGGDGETGSGRGRVEQKEQGQKVAEKVEPKQEIGYDKEVQTPKQNVRKVAPSVMDSERVRPILARIEMQEVPEGFEEVTPPPKKNLEGYEEVKPTESQIAGLKPAVKIDDKIITGEVGDTHDDILKKEGLSKDEGQRGFVAEDTPKGKILNRKEAINKLKRDHPDILGAIENKKALHSEDLAQATEEVVKETTEANSKSPVNANEEAIKRMLEKRQTPEEMSTLLKIPVEEAKKIGGQIKAKQGIYDLLQDMKSQDTPSAKRNFVLDAQKRAKELRSQGINAEVKQSRNGWKLYIDSIPQDKNSLGMANRGKNVDITSIKVKPEAEKLFEELPEEKQSYQTIVAENFVEPSDLPKGMGEKGLKKAIQDIKDDDGAEQSPEAKIVRNAAEDILAKGKEIKQIKGSKSTEELSPEDIKSFVVDKIKEDTSFNFGENVESGDIEDIFGNIDKEAKVKSKTKKPEQLEMEGLGAPKMKGSEDYLKPKGKGEETTPLFKQEEGQKESLFDDIKDNQSIKKAAKELADKVRKAKINKPGELHASIGADLAWNTGVEAVAKSIEIGGDIAQAVKDGVDAVKESDWYKNLRKDQQQEAEKQFAKYHTDLLSEEDVAESPRTEILKVAPSKAVVAEEGTQEANIADKTSLKNKYSQAERQNIGLSPLETRIRQTAPEIFDEVKRDYNPQKVRTMAKAIVEKPDTVISRKQQLALLYDKLNLRNERDKITSGYNKAVDKADTDNLNLLQAELLRNEEDIDFNTRATKQFGTTVSDIFRDRQLLADLDKGTLEHELAKARAKNGNRPISEESKKVITDAIKEKDAKMAELEAQLKAEQDKNVQLQSDIALKKMQREAALETRKRGRAQSKEEIKKNRESLYNKLYTVQNAKLSGTVNPFQGFTPEAIKLMGQIAKSYVEEGMLTAKDIVDRIHEEIKDKFEGVDKAAIMDAITGYGKDRRLTQNELTKQYNDVKSQMLNLRKLEMLERGEKPVSNKAVKRELSPELTKLRADVKAKMQDMKIENPELDMKKRAASAKSKINSEIGKLVEWFETGRGQNKPARLPKDEETWRLKDIKDRIKSVKEEIEGEKSFTDTQKINAKQSQLFRAIDEYERKLKEFKETGRVKPKVGQPALMNLEIIQLTHIKDNLKAELDNLKKSSMPPKEPFQAYKTRLENKAKDLQDRINKKDFSIPEKKSPIEYPQHIKDLQGEIKRLDNTVKREQKKIEYENKSTFDKAMYQIAKFARGMKLTSAYTIGKLTSFSIQKLAAKPFEEALGGLYSQIPGLKGIANQAPIEGKFAGIQAELKALKEFGAAINKKDFMDIMKSGKSNFSLRVGDDIVHLELKPNMLDYFARLHYVLKEPLKRSTYDRTYTKYRSWQEKDNVNMDDPTEMHKATTYAYNEALRNILLKDNRLTEFYSTMLNSLGNKGKTGKAFETTARVLLPIVRVPTNYVFEGSEYIAGSLKGTVSILRHVIDGSIKNLKPEEADYIMRNLKKGTVGAALLYFGYKNPDKFGGYYEKGKKKGENEAEFGGMRLFNTNIPRWLVHNPMLEALQFGASLRRAIEEKQKNKKEDSPITEALWKTSKGLAEEIPFVDMPRRFIDSGSTAKSVENFIGDLIAGSVTLPDLARVAKTMDKDEQGKPVLRQKGLIGSTVQNIPGLRKLVPEYKPKKKSEGRGEIY